MMSDVQNDERLQRLQRELELIPQIQQAMMQANKGLEMLMAIGGLTQAEAQWANQTMLSVWDRAMVLEGIARGREIALAQSRPAQQAVQMDDAPVEMSEGYDELAAETADAQDAEGGVADDGDVHMV